MEEMQAHSWQNPLDLEFLERKPRVKGKRVYAAVAFGDITRFQEWTNHPLTSVEKHTKFMVQLYEEFIRFRNGSGYFVKILADGLMAVKELPEGAERKRLVLKMMVDTIKLVDSVNKLIGRSPIHRPGLFRVRHTTGDVLRLEATHPTDSTRKQIDYTDYTVNLAHGLLEVAKDVPCICHESSWEIIEPSPSMVLPIKFQSIEEPSFCPEGILKNDLKNLRAYSAG
jgi:class 3 adenylate cyclase